MLSVQGIRTIVIVRLHLASRCDQYCLLMFAVRLMPASSPAHYRNAASADSTTELGVGDFMF